MCFKGWMFRCRESWAQRGGHCFNSFMVLGGLRAFFGTIKEASWSRSPKSCACEITLFSHLSLAPSLSYCFFHFLLLKKKKKITISNPFFFISVLLSAVTIRGIHICELFNFSPLKRNTKCEAAPKCWCYIGEELAALRECILKIIIIFLKSLIFTKQNFNKIDHYPVHSLLPWGEKKQVSWGRRL